MVQRKLMVVAILVTSLPTLARATDGPVALKRPKPGDVLSILSGTSNDALAGSLRGYLAHNLPATLYEASPGWGQMKMAAGGKLKNDGTWKRIHFTADNLPNTLILDIRNVQQPEPGRTTFEVFLAFDAHMEYERQKWESGIRFSSASIRARFRVKLALQCELTTHLEPSNIILPDAVFRLHVTKSNLQYDNVVVEHALGLGGEAAKLMGDAASGILHSWHPSLEHDLLQKADAAIVKAGDTKEVHLGLARLLKGKN